MGAVDEGGASSLRGHHEGKNALLHLERGRPQGTMAPKDYKTVGACCLPTATLDPTDIKVCCVSEGEELCCFGKYCCAAGEAAGPGHDRGGQGQGRSRVGTKTPFGY